ncbi:hypothetical protein H5119_02640 [Pseudoalteromonas sp. SG45-5]|uniref:hypothetical protein n=1 Tax=unclassified Pseudoalteromonas TaxID=194690 RepID=UPI0015FB1677|nr:MULTISPECIES: hypothetical protein [unclassified Pseudoalteromonas]MBB1384459.1 hypothetical protein [Pseudoalteromonas sp. SG45-5]MBB1395465.1 hypothetical protein [Pseudoalteromonas sp. SG44-4]MBB1448520.1 hypothetical protein [Pseudoalteromonas sp. SG41-6]
MKTNTVILVLTFIVSTLSLAQAQTKNTAVKPGAAIIASLTSQANNANSLQLGDIITDSQSGNGLKLTGEVLLQLTTQADFSQLATRYNLQLKHRVGDIVVVITATNNIQQLVQQLTQEPTIKQASFDLSELGLSADPQVINEEEN